MLKFWETVFRRCLPFSLWKNTHGKFAEKFGEKICFSLFFPLCFLLFSGHPILRAFLNLQIEKIRAESVLEISLNLFLVFDHFFVTVFLFLVTFCLSPLAYPHFAAQRTKRDNAMKSPLASQMRSLLWVP